MNAPAARRAAEVAAAAQLACLLEVSAPKPGNVSPGRHFEDLRYEDFLAGAAAIGAPLAGAGRRPLGRTIRLAVEASARWTRSNANLGIVLLLAPLARAAVGSDPGDTPCRGQTPGSGDSTFPAKVASVGHRGLTLLREAVRSVLDATTIDDARDVYAAIRAAAPGGLGRVEAQDVAGEPTVTLLEVMRLAADRDGIAREYATAFETTFERGAPSLGRARRDGLDWDDAVVETFLTLLAAEPDTHIARRAGWAAAQQASSRARAVLDAGGVRSGRGRQAVAALDRELRDGRHLGNPGTTADLTAAAIFVWLLEGGRQRA